MAFNRNRIVCLINYTHILFQSSTFGTTYSCFTVVVDIVRYYNKKKLKWFRNKVDFLFRFSSDIVELSKRLLFGYKVDILSSGILYLNFRILSSKTCRYISLWVFAYSLKKKMTMMVLDLCLLYLVNVTGREFERTN